MPGNLFGTGRFVKKVGLPEHNIRAENAFYPIHNCRMCTQIVDRSAIEMPRFLPIDIKRTFGFKNFMLNNGPNAIHFFWRMHRIWAEIPLVVKEPRVFWRQVIGHFFSLLNKSDLSLKLAHIQIVIKSLRLQQRPMRPAFNNLPVVNDQNLIHIADRAQSVGNNKTRAPLHQP